MREASADEVRARELGLALLEASRAYEGFFIPARVGLLRRRPFPPHRRAIIGLVGRQRRFLRAAYTLADAGEALEALGPLRSMFEFWVIQLWLARDPDRNWKLWMEEGHANRERFNNRLRDHSPALHDAAVAALTSEQLSEQDTIAVVRARVKEELGLRLRDDARTTEQRAGQVGLAFLYDIFYRYESSILHPTLLAVDAMLEDQRGGVRLRAEPEARYVPLSIYLHAALLLREAVRENGEAVNALRPPELPAISEELHALAERTTTARLRNWRDFLPAGFEDQGR